MKIVSSSLNLGVSYGLFTYFYSSISTVLFPRSFFYGPIPAILFLPSYCCGAIAAVRRPGRGDLKMPKAFFVLPLWQLGLDKFRDIQNDLGIHMCLRIIIGNISLSGGRHHEMIQILILKA